MQPALSIKKKWNKFRKTQFNRNCILNHHYKEFLTLVPPKHGKTTQRTIVDFIIIFIIIFRCYYLNVYLCYVLQEYNQNLLVLFFYDSKTTSVVVDCFGSLLENAVES